MVAVFFLSGVSGLIYQVVWVRQLGLVFGNTVESAALVAGVFIAALGAGSYVIGKVGDRAYYANRRRPLVLYGLSELVIAACGLALSLAIPRLSALSAATSSYVSGPHGWHTLSVGSYAARYVVATLLIAPPTFVMGGTLTLLVRYLVGTTVGSAAERVAGLYGANTAGAAAGALLTDLVLVPSLGLFRTQLVAVAINVAAGGVALALARPRASAGGSGVAPSVALSESTGERNGAIASTAVALGLAGFTAMGLEILWFRLLSTALVERRAVFSLLLAAILTGIGLGAFAGGRLHRWLGRPALALLVAECLLAVTTLGLLGLVSPHALGNAALRELKAPFDAAPAWLRALLEVWVNLRPIAAMVAAPSFLMGMSFPLANASVQRVEAMVGRRAGGLYLATCAGNLVGSFVVGFGLIPALGAQTTALLLCACATATAAPLYLSGRPYDTEAKAREAAVTVAAAVGAAVVALAAFAALPGDYVVRASFALDARAGTREVLDLSEGPNETIAVTEIPGFFRELLTNGHPMSSTHPKAQRYMRAFAHVPLLLMEEGAKRALVICFGVGTTTNAAALHRELERIDVADLSRNVLEHARWFAASNHDVLADPRVSVFVNDGREHLLMQPEETYDLITLEPPPISAAGVAALYSREFYRLARSRLTRRGFITQWLPAYQVQEAEVRAAVRAFVDVFPEALLVSGDDNELILVGTRGASLRLDLDAVSRRLAAAPEIKADLDRVELGDLTDLAGMFAASRRTLLAATASTPPVTDDLPSLEYSDRSPLADRRMPKDLFDVTDVETWCAGCLSRLPRLAGYLKVRGAMYASDAFLVTSANAPAAFDLSSVPDGAMIVAENPSLISLLGGSALPARRAAQASFDAGRVAEAIDLLDLARSYDPGDPETYDLLARLLMTTGRPAVAEEARAVAATLRKARPVSPR